jgi:hypothetical protein
VEACLGVGGKAEADRGASTANGVTGEDAALGPAGMFGSRICGAADSFTDPAAAVAPAFCAVQDCPEGCVAAVEAAHGCPELLPLGTEGCLWVLCEGLCKLKGKQAATRLVG